MISQIVLPSAATAINYDFCELLPASISGQVHADPEQDCIVGPRDVPLAGVVVQLLNATGSVVATTLTDSQGRYRFDGLAPGVYSVYEVQPAGYSDGNEHAGTAGGVIAGNDLITQIVLGSGTQGLNYDFCEVPLGAISGYVFQDGPTIVVPRGRTIDANAVRDGRRDPGDPAITGVTLLLGDASGEPIRDALGQPRVAVTNSAGYYQFTGLLPGVYTVRQIQPEDYLDFKDTAGSSGGIAINRDDLLSPLILQTLTVAHNFDAIIRIPLPAGVNSVENNFSEVKMAEERPPIILAEPINAQPPRIHSFKVLSPTVPPKFFPEPIPVFVPPDFFARHNAVGQTWHLSVIDGGVPRGPDGGEITGRSASRLVQRRHLERRRDGPCPVDARRANRSAIADAAVWRT